MTVHNHFNSKYENPVCSHWWISFGLSAFFIHKNQTFLDFLQLFHKSLTVSVETSVTSTLFSIQHGVQFTPFAPAVYLKAFWGEQCQPFVDAPLWRVNWYVSALTGRQSKICHKRSVLLHPPQPLKGEHPALRTCLDNLIFEF